LSRKKTTTGTAGVEMMIVVPFAGKKPRSALVDGQVLITRRRSIDGFEIGDTIADFEKPEQLEIIHIDEPTMNMLFTINTSPFFGKEGKFVTSRHLRASRCCSTPNSWPTISLTWPSNSLRISEFSALSPPV